ncbi:MAG TPA: cytochrome c oxidase assembly protein [Actinomycetota bacterium]|nr:cytochrome c oxidase assembly protein [Actinomycetota bacterium]
MVAASSPWGFHMHPDVWLLVVALTGGYWWMCRRERERNAGNALAEPPATRTQKWLFGSGVFVLWLGADWPIHDVAEGSMYSVHMIQHMLFTLGAAPLLLLGTPAWMFRRLVRPAPMFKAVRTMSRPFVALVFFNVVLIFTHWPAMVTASVGSELVHLSLHVLIMASALAMWMPVASPVMEIPRMSYPGQMVYLFLQSLVPTIPASFLTFGSTPLYSVYVDMPKLWGISPMTDQLTAGLIMKIVGGFILWGVIATLFFKWYKIEQSEGIDVLALSRLDRELNRGATR